VGDKNFKWCHIKRLTMRGTNYRFRILGTNNKNHKNRVKIHHWYWQPIKISGKLNFYIVHICHLYGRWEVYLSARFYFSALIILAHRCIGTIKLNKCTKVNSKRKYSKEHLSGSLFFGTDFNSLIHLWWPSLLFRVMVTSLCYCGNTFLKTVTWFSIQRQHKIVAVAFRQKSN
jgi:hypothetical protein